MAISTAGALGTEGAKMQQRELAALASVRNPYQVRQQALHVTGAHTAALAWLNAGAVADPNVFSHPVSHWINI